MSDASYDSDSESDEESGQASSPSLYQSSPPTNKNVTSYGSLANNERSVTNSQQQYGIGEIPYSSPYAGQFGHSDAMHGGGGHAPLTANTNIYQHYGLGQSPMNLPSSAHMGQSEVVDSRRFVQQMPFDPPHPSVPASRDFGARPKAGFQRSATARISTHAYGQNSHSGAARASMNAMRFPTHSSPKLYFPGQEEEINRTLPHPAGKKTIEIRDPVRVVRPTSVSKSHGRSYHSPDKSRDINDINSGASKAGVRMLDQAKLKEWAESKNTIILVFDMSANIDGLSKLLKQGKLGFDSLCNLIMALKKVISLQTQKASLNYVLKCICESRFLDVHLITFLQDLEKKKDSSDIYGHFEKITDIIDFLVKNLPACIPHCSQPARKLMDTGKRLNILSESSDLTKRVQDLISRSAGSSTPKFEVPDYEPRKYYREKDIPYTDEDEPPDNYKNMKLFPDTEELDISIEPFLRKNKTRGAYRNLTHYLDIHARLMREDYVAPIRIGLKDYKQSLHNDSKVKEDNLRFYYGVKIVKMGASEQGITHFVTFDTKPLSNIEWEFSRRLMFGSLLVFSKDNFETTVFATVANRDAPKLARGVLEVVFQNNLEEILTSSDNDTFIMAETTAYFESYRHVLEGLQEMDSIPLEKYIVSCKREIRPPSYLQDDTLYNVSCIMNDVYDEYPVPALDPDEWPVSSNTVLNESQLEALQLALSKEMAVIQGPPGTGKTYVGLRIMRILLENKITRRAGLAHKRPILVVCFTNHALDQFLEGIQEFCPEGIVRIGGRSTSQKLENCNLKKLREAPAISRRLKDKININLAKCRGELKKIMRIIQKYWQESLRLETTILKLNDLKDEMSEEHYMSLTDRRRCPMGRASHVISTWLKAMNANMDNHLSSAAKRHLAKLIAKRTDIKSDACINNKKAAGKLDFKSRVQTYSFWLESYKRQLEREMELVLISSVKERDQLIQEKIRMTEEAGSDILPDEMLKPYMSENVFESIVVWVQSEYETTEENMYIRSWLLSQFTTTDQLLDAVEQLTEVKPGNKQSHGRKNIIADSEASIHEERWVIDDSEDSQGSSSDESEDDDDDDDDEYEYEPGTGVSGMDDVDDGGRIKISAFAEQEENYKQFSNKEVNMMQRARFLGIDLEDRGEVEEEWQSYSNMSYSKVFKLYHSTKPFTDDEVSQITDVWGLQLRDRYKLYKYWVQQRKTELTNRIIVLTREYKLIQERKKEALSLKDIAILRKAKVIGMTTTGAARLRSVLQEVACPIIVVEEAAEVLEAHIVTTLNKECQHLILIGDHQQLRPSPTVHKLAVKYELEISLFERLVRNGVPRVTLCEQHRMRPEISLFVQHIYPKLEDHISVQGYDDIRGVSSNIFFLHHNFEESAVEDSTSKDNVHEAKFLTGLCRYFLQHGYQGNQITILSAYGGQVKAIREAMDMAEDEFEFVRVTSIDNYQGEENDIILLSLVRSNTENEVGFLKTNNRVCVAMSRAKMGLFVIGNIQLLARKSELWHSIAETAEANHVTGVNMKLVCVNHAHHVTYVSNAEDFVREVPEGGCNRRCDYVLPCGHTCTRMCHASDRFHENTKCEQPCLKMCPEGHPCQKDCYRECGLCEVRVTKVIPSCGHRDQVPCHLSVDEVICSQTCGQILRCGHICRGQCGRCREDESHHPCSEVVDLKWPCGHESRVECRTDTSVEPCPAKCREKLACGHRCRGTCGECLSGRVHKVCKEKCQKPLPCGHPCQGPCGGQCTPCQMRCPTSCRHVSCSKQTCGEPCDLCTENCALVCQHKSCSGRCMDECQDQACTKKCNKLQKKCNHKCMSLCGEPCVCYQCEKEKFSLIESSNKKKPQFVVAHEKQQRAKKFDVGDDTVLMKLQKCGHIFTLNQLDRHVEKFEPDGTSYVRCPNCPAPVQGLRRYENNNKKRAERRAIKKTEIIEATTVSTEKVESLIQSAEIVSDFCTVDEGMFLSRKPEKIDCNHALALTLQIRFAFVLSKVNDIHENFNSDNELNVARWKCVITNIQGHVSKQLKEELTLELRRLLLVEQILALGKLVKNMCHSLPDELKARCKTALKRLQDSLTSEIRNESQSVVDELYKQFNELDQLDFWYGRMLKLKQTVRSAEMILAQPETQDLCSLPFETVST